MFLILVRESLTSAWQSLAANKLRSFLSLLGITIGIFAIILVFTIVDSLESSIRGTIQSLGNNVVYVQKWPWSFGPDYPWWKYINRPTPRYDELEELQKRCKTTDAIAYWVSSRKIIKYQSSSVKNAIVGGISYDYFRMKSMELSMGRYFTRGEIDAGYRVVVIGAGIAEGLFPGQDPVGKDIKVGGFKATVIGVVKKQGESFLGESMDYVAMIPYHFAKYMMETKGDEADPTIFARARPGLSNVEMIDELTGVMRSVRRLKPRAGDDFALNESSMITKGFEPIFAVIGTIGWVIGGFSILVGGFGIANIMFVSVRERTSFIGIQKSLGARNIFILLQFLGESVMLCLLGGSVGLFLTWLITLAGSSLVDMDIVLTGSNVVLGLTISVLIGIISGFIPAYSASQLDPVEAIRAN